MTSIQVCGIVFACVFGGALLGLYLHSALSDRHLTAESRDLVKLGMGLIATMSALALGLLIATAKSSYDTQRSEVVQISATVVLLDRVLAHYGPETKESRELLRSSVSNYVTLLWSEPGSQAQVGATGGEALFGKIEELAPQNDAQRSLKTRAESMIVELGRMRWLLVAQSSSEIPRPFLVVLIFWLTIIFVSFGLSAPRNATTLITLFVCALSVSLAIFLILELNRPFDGFIQISSAPLRNALALLGQ
ncbi:MAG: DUF4239 domain-containing protein [Pyrinomonadaceae bacterium]|nr:DUF4239 domain-containing protein [Pyrinomonadaceae bacterium]